MLQYTQGGENVVREYLSCSYKEGGCDEEIVERAGGGLGRSIVLTDSQRNCTSFIEYSCYWLNKHYCEDEGTSEIL